MAEISRIQGPSGPPDKSRASRKPDADKFKEEMQRVDEVSKIDPDEAKKRKRPEETLREEELSRSAAQAEPEKKIKTEGTGALKISSTEEAGGVSKGPSEEVSPAMDTQHVDEPVASKKDVEREKRVGVHEAHEQTLHETLGEVKQRTEEGHKMKTQDAAAEEGMNMPAAPEASEDAKRQGVKGIATAPMVAPVTSMAPTEPTKVEKPQPEEKILFPEEPPPAYTHLHPDVLDIFERVVGALVYLDQSGIKETTITIASSEEKPSAFNGAQITIREYSTAPKQFNIELSGAPKAVDLFRDNMQDLKQAFDTIPYTFKVNSIETSLQ